MARSIWKGPYIDLHILKKIKKVTDNKNSKKNQLEMSQNNNKIFSRRSVICPTFQDNVCLVHLGNGFRKVTLIQDLIGHRFGEFAFTKKVAIYKRKSKLKGKNKSKK